MEGSPAGIRGRQALTAGVNLRRVARMLLRSAVSISPKDTLGWGEAMLSELNYVEGGWAALIWAIGGAGVLAKHALLPEKWM